MATNHPAPARKPGAVVVPHPVDARKAENAKLDAADAAARAETARLLATFPVTGPDPEDCFDVVVAQEVHGLPFVVRGLDGEQLGRFADSGEAMRAGLDAAGWLTAVFAPPA